MSNADTNETATTQTGFPTGQLLRLGHVNNGLLAVFSDNEMDEQSVERATKVYRQLTASIEAVLDGDLQHEFSSLFCTDTDNQSSGDTLTGDELRTLGGALNGWLNGALASEQLNKATPDSDHTVAQGTATGRYL